MSNLRLLNETEITSSISSITVNNLFSSDFDIYKIVWNNISTTGTVYTEIKLRFVNSSGSIITTANYDYAHLLMATNTSFSEVRATNQTQLANFTGYFTDQAPEGNEGVAYIFNPFSSSSYSFVINQNFGGYAGINRIEKYIGVLTETTPLTGINLFESSTRPFDSGVIRTYGLRVDT